MDRNQNNTNAVNVQDEKPQELCCTICEKLMTDAVLLPCCGKSFCKECTYYYLYCCVLSLVCYLYYFVVIYILIQKKHRLKNMGAYLFRCQSLVFIRVFFF
jgi:hypothetical protein